MKVKVIGLYIENVSDKIINHDMNGYINIGDEFTVFAISILNEITYFQIYSDKKLMSVPSLIFEILDGSVSKFWVFRKNNLNTLFWPKEFFLDYFHDDLLEGIPDTVKKFNEVKIKIESESIC